MPRPRRCRRLRRDGRRAAHPGSLRAVRARNFGDRGARAGWLAGRPTTRPKTSIARASCIPRRYRRRFRRRPPQAAREAAFAILQALDYVGVIGVEFFVLEDGALVANEIAPRVHNSGHWTEAACAISQFEQHIRAIAGLPLGDTARHSDCVMENLIGDDVFRAPRLLAEPDLVLHLYGKAEARPGRKMGHFTRLLRHSR